MGGFLSGLGQALGTVAGAVGTKLLGSAASSLFGLGNGMLGPATSGAAQNVIGPGGVTAATQGPALIQGTGAANNPLRALTPGVTDSQMRQTAIQMLMNRITTGT